MKENDVLTLLLVGLGAWIVWEYVLGPMMTQQTAAAAGTSVPVTNLPAQTSTPAPVATGTQAAASAPSTPAVTAAQLQQMAKVVLLTPDQWAYYYNSLPGKSISASQMETILAKLSLTDATRATTVTAAQFVSALTETGLSGITPSWPAGGGPAFNAFIPAGATFAGGFSGVNRGFRAAPGKWVQ